MQELYVCCRRDVHLPMRLRVGVFTFFVGGIIVATFVGGRDRAKLRQLKEDRARKSTAEGDRWEQVRSEGKHEQDE